MTGDIDPYFSWGHIYYSDLACSSQAYFDLSMRYEIIKLDSNYFMADDNAAPACIVLTYYKSTDYSYLCSSRYPSCVSVLPAKNITLPFAMPVPLPLKIGN